MGKRLTRKLLEILLFHPDFTNEELADMLDITELGIKSRIKRVNRILGTKSRAGAQITALQAGIVPLAKVKPLVPVTQDGISNPTQHVHASRIDQSTGELAGQYSVTLA